MRASVPTRLPERQPDHEPQSRPGLVDRADLVVDEAGGKGNLSDYILSDVGRDSRSFLRPGNPEAPCRRHVTAGRGYLSLQFRAARHEDHNNVEARLTRKSDLDNGLAGQIT